MLLQRGVRGSKDGVYLSVCYVRLKECVFDQLCELRKRDCDVA
jgi:hypothetical protein